MDPVSQVNQLSRLAGILQTIFYHFRQKTYDSPVKKIEYTFGIMYVYDSNGTDDRCQIEELLGLCDGEHDKKTLLARFACSEAVGLMAGMLMYGLSKINCRVLAPKVEVKNPHRKFMKVFLNGRSDEYPADHEFFKITLLDAVPEQHYALDLTSAQYGYYNSLMSFDEYIAERVKVLKMEQDLQSVKVRFLGYVTEDEPGRHERKNKSAAAILSSIKEWEDQTKFSLADILCLPEEDFIKRKDELLHMVLTILWHGSAEDIVDAARKGEAWGYQ